MTPDGPNAVRSDFVVSDNRGTTSDPELVDLMLLPPVFARIVREQKRRLGPARPRAVNSERRKGKSEPAVPDVTFRWRLESPSSLPQDQRRQAAPR